MNEQFVVSKDDLSRWSKRSILSTAKDISVNVTLIAMAIIWSISVGGIFAYVLSVIVIGARQHAVLNLLHEAVHGGLAENRKINDFLGQVIGWAFFFDFVAYRASHLAHHRYLNTERDPDWCRFRSPGGSESSEYNYPMSKRRLGRLVVADLLGLRIIQMLSKITNYQKKDSLNENSFIPMLTFYFTLLLILYLFDGWIIYVAYWLVPIFTWLKMNLRLRLLSEHFSVFGKDGLRTVVTNPIERFFIWPHNVAYHAHHHHYPMVRARFLPLLADKLDDQWYEKNHIAKTAGMKELIREATDTKNEIQNKGL